MLTRFVVQVNHRAFGLAPYQRYRLHQRSIPFHRSPLLCAFVRTEMARSAEMISKRAVSWIGLSLGVSTKCPQFACQGIVARIALQVPC